MGLKRVTVYGKRGEKGYKLRGEVRKERADARPKDGEAVLFSADVNVTNDPADTMVDVWTEIGLDSENDARRIAVGAKVYATARKALGVSKADDIDPGYWKRDDVYGNDAEKRAVCDAVAEAWGPKRAAKQAAKLGIDYEPPAKPSPKKALDDEGEDFSTTKTITVRGKR